MLVKTSPNSILRALILVVFLASAILRPLILLSFYGKAQK